MTKGFAEERLRAQTLLIPISIDNAFKNTDKAWAVKLRDSRYVQDFSAWADPQVYRKCFERLLKAFKNEVVDRPWSLDQPHYAALETGESKRLLGGKR